ncbi:MAG: SH3 domain-containing protein [Acidobacteria bacterium]|nr:SH3 domain-containing protein [Acidobacteriota bacterium]
MKQCPNCKTTYTDESLRFCLTDGANLIFAPDAAETVRMSFANEPVRVNVPPDSAPTVFAPPIAQTPPAKKGVSPIIVGILGVLLLLVVGLFAVYILLRTTRDKNSTILVSPTPTASPAVSKTDAPTDETAALKEKLASLERQMQDQKNQKQAAPANTFSPSKQTLTTARANSPRDGFLALRSEPNSETGYRIAQIPHGAVLTVLGCPKPSNIGKMAGRWCQVTYNGQSGWAFDKFMIF